MSKMLPQRVTTNETVRLDLLKSLIDRGLAKQAGRTVGEFIQTLYALGLKDGDWLSSVEFGIRAGGSGVLTVEDHGSGWEAREL